jgi:hypothetical protein
MAFRGHERPHGDPFRLARVRPVGSSGRLFHGPPPAGPRSGHRCSEVDHRGLFGMAGASSGMAIAYAAEHPKKVSRLFLQELHARARLAGQPSAQQLAEANARLKVTLKWAAKMTRQLIATSSPHCISRMLRYSDLCLQSPTALNDDCRLTPKLLHTFWSAELSQIAKDVSCPAIVFHARDDSHHPFLRRVSLNLRDESNADFGSRPRENETSWPCWRAGSAMMRSRPACV